MTVKRYYGLNEKLINNHKIHFFLYFQDVFIKVENFLSFLLGLIIYVYIFVTNFFYANI